MKYWLMLGFTSILLMLSASSFSQEKRSLNRETWQELKDKTDYSERQKIKEKPKPNQETKEPQFDETSHSGPDISGLGYLLIGVVIVVLLIGIIVLINQNNKSAAVSVKRRQAKSLEDAEEELPEVELTDLFQEQLDLGEWRLALRVKFLMILQDLIDQKFIIWQKQKTNQQFASEISDVQIRLKFKHIANTFDAVWYGDEELSKAQFEQVIFTLNSLHNQLNESE